jgi:GNAT superfamily N-acetyltransferase
MRYLAAKDNDPVIARALILQAEEYARSRNGERLKAFVPMVQPYVDYYKDLGFISVRRDLRVVWDLEKLEAIPDDPSTHVGFEIREFSEGMAEEASRVWGLGMTPHWDWWLEEQGGLEAGSAWVKDSVRENDPWLGVFARDDRMIGVTVVWYDLYGPGEARFNGVYVLPEERGRGIGSRLLQAIIARTKAKGQRSMNVYTMSPLDHLAPGPVMYLKSGGKIEAEYTRLEKVIV